MAPRFFLCKVHRKPIGSGKIFPTLAIEAPKTTLSQEAAMKGHHRSLLVTAVLISSLLLSTLMHVSRAEVITLTESTFSDKVKEKDTAWFVKFCVPWCKHCKNLGSLWEDLGKTMEGEDEVEVGEVDCGTNKPLCSKVSIRSYPTFKLFYNGEEAARYRGARDVELMKTFVLEETEKAAANAQLEDDKDL